MRFFFAYTIRDREYSLEYTDRLNHHVAVYISGTFKAYVFRLENNIWFRISISRLDGASIQVEDEEVILQMIDSILLNNRNSYYEPIELVLP